MSTFDENIRKQFEEGAVNYNPDHWEALRKKLDDLDAQKDDQNNSSNEPSAFEQKANTILNSGKVAFNAEHWDILNEKLNASDAPSTFDKKAADILNNGEIAFNPAHFSALENKLNNIKTPFEKKSKDILESGKTPYDQENWNELESELEPNLTGFEQKAKDILEAAGGTIPLMNFDAFSDKMHQEQLSSFEQNLQTKLNNGAVEYNPEHWEDLQRRMDKKKRRPIIWWITGAAAAVVSAVVLISTPSGEPNSRTNANNGIGPETSVSEGHRSSVSNDLQRENNTSKNNSVFPNPIEADEYNPENKGVITKNSNSSSTRSSTNLSKHSSSKVNSFNSTKHNTWTNNNTKANEEQPKTGNNVLEEKDGWFKLVFAPSKNIGLAANNRFSLNKDSNDYKFNPLALPVESQIHPGALLWLNMWDNPAVTGLYGKNHFSSVYKNDWFYGEDEETNSGKTDFIRPLHFQMAFERNFGGLSVGAYLKHEQKVNWKYSELNLSASYNKEILPRTYVRVGAGATYHWNKIDVNNLSLKEQLFDSETYNITMESTLDRLNPKIFITYHGGALISHPYFFAGYTVNNFAQSNINVDDAQLMNHNAIAGIHLPIGKKLKVSPLFKYCRELKDRYSPGIGLSYNKKLYLNSVYNNLNRYDFSVGYLFAQKLRVGATFGINQLENESKELNLNKFQEREGYVMGGIFYTFN